MIWYTRLWIVHSCSFSPLRRHDFLESKDNLFENSTKIVPESETSGLDNNEDFEDFITVDDVTTAENK